MGRSGGGPGGVEQGSVEQESVEPGNVDRAGGSRGRAGGSRGRAGKLACAMLLAGALLAGCGGPSKLGSAAIVGDTTIPLGHVQHRISALIKEKPAAKQLLRRHKLDTAARSLVTAEVQHELIGRVARKQGLRADRALVHRQLHQPGLDRLLRNQVLDRAGYGEYVADRTKLAALARKQAPGLRVRTDIVTVGGPSKAKRLARRVAARPGDTARLMRAADPGAGIDQTVRPVQDLQLAASTPLFGTSPGTVLAFRAGEQTSTWYVARVRERTHGKPGPAARKPLDRLGPEGLSALGQRLIVPAGQRIGVRLNPRYGVWDPYGLRAVEGDGQREVTAYRVHGTGA